LGVFLFLSRFCLVVLFRVFRDIALGELLRFTWSRRLSGINVKKVLLEVDRVHDLWYSIDGD
jgi:hypothetical protein